MPLLDRNGWKEDAWSHQAALGSSELESKPDTLTPLVPSEVEGRGSESVQAPLDCARDERDGVIVEYADLGEALTTNHRLGVRIPNNLHPSELAGALDRLGLIAIDFPKFSDGRGFSIGKMLRQAGFRGVLRASGAILPDQFAFALHCGFDEVEISEEQAARQPIGQWLHALTLVTESYQDTEDGMTSILKRRRRAA